MHDDIPLDQAITNALKDAAKVSRRQQRKSAASKPFTQKVGDIMKAKQSLKSKAAHAEVVARGNFVAEFGSTAGWQSETYVQPKNGEAWAYKAYNYDAGNPLVAEIDTAHWIAAYQSQKKARGNRRPDRTELNKVGIVNYNQGSKVYSVRIDEHHRVNFVRDARKS